MYCFFLILCLLLIITYEVCLKSNATVSIKHYIYLLLTNQDCRLGNCPLGGHKSTEALLPLLVAVLEVNKRNRFQLVHSE